MPTAANEVVFVPGFGGTTLSYRGGFGGKTNYWYNPAIMASTNPLAGALASDGVSPYPVLGKLMTPGGPVDMGIYEPILTALANAGYNPVFWGYDWRLNAQTLATQFAEYLISANLSNPFQVVCHSYGGLVAQLAYPLYQALTGKKTWRQTIYLGTPHGGSHWAAAALGGWFPSGSELALLGRLFKLVAPTAQGLKSGIYTAAQVAIGELVGSWPGLYCLLPNPGGVWANDDPNAGQLLQLTTYSDTWGGQQAQWFALASTVTAAIVTGLSAARPPELCIVGFDTDTLAEFNGGQANPGLLASFTNGDGDGTVTTHRAMLPTPAYHSEFGGVGHQELTTNQSTINAVLQALANLPGSNVTVTPIPPSTVEIPLPPAAVNPPVVVYPFANLHADP